MIRCCSTYFKTIHENELEAQKSSNASQHSGNFRGQGQSYNIKYKKSNMIKVRNGGTCYLLVQVDQMLVF